MHQRLVNLTAAAVITRLALGTAWKHDIRVHAQTSSKKVLHARRPIIALADDASRL
jgi:hypothetical protein